MMSISKMCSVKATLTIGSLLDCTFHSNYVHKKEKGKEVANRWRDIGNSDRLFSWAPKSLRMMTALKLKDTCSLEEKPRQHIKKQRHYFADKGPSSQSYGFSSSHVWM